MNQQKSSRSTSQIDPASSVCSIGALPLQRLPERLSEQAMLELLAKSGRAAVAIRLIRTHGSIR